MIKNVLIGRVKLYSKQVCWSHTDMDLLIFIIINLLQAIYQETTIRKRKEQREKI